MMFINDEMREPTYDDLKRHWCRGLLQKDYEKLVIGIK